MCAGKACIRKHRQASINAPIAAKTRLYASQQRQADTYSGGKQPGVVFRRSAH
jgi:hypothetical protein